MKITVSMKKTMNTGDMEFVHLGMDVETELDNIKDAELLWKELKAALDVQAEPYLAEQLPPPKMNAEEADIHEPAAYDGDEWETGDEGEYLKLDARKCWMVHTETSKGQEAVKIGPHKGKNSMWGIYLWKNIRTTVPVLDNYHDWPMAQSDQKKGFITGKMSLPDEISEVVVRTSGDFYEIVALR